MKKNQFSYSRMAAAIAIVCATAWPGPSSAWPEKGTHQEAGTTGDANTATNTSEENQLILALEKDGLIDQIKGFLVEKKQRTLFVNGKQLPDNLAGKYIAALKKEEIRVQIYPIAERLKQHPNASLLQILLPVSLSSPCVDKKPKKEGC